MKTPYLTFLLPIILSNLFAETIIVSGRVMDKNTEQPIANVNIVHEQGGTSSDATGKFIIEWVKKTDEIIFQHIGYQDIVLTAKEIDKIIYLSPTLLHAKKIIVHSGLREVSFLDSPYSISIFGKSNIDTETSHHFQGLTQLIPNLNWAGGTSRPRYFQIRGIGERSLYTGEGAPNFSVGFIIDDIDFTGIGMPGLLFDLNQVEVFRGPQSSIFGSNAMGGLISMRSVHPKSLFESSIQTTISTENTRHIGISVNTPILANLNTRLSVFSSVTDGFRENQYTNTSNSDGKNELLFRNKSTWLPYSFIEFNLTTLYSKQNNKYDVWAPDNNKNLFTYSDREGKDSQVSRAFSLRSSVKDVAGFNFLSITTYSLNEMEHSYDGDWGNSALWSQDPYNFDSNIEGWEYDFFDKTIKNRTTMTEEFRIHRDLSNKSSVIIGTYGKFLSERDDASGYLFAGDASKYDGNFDIINIAGYMQYEQKLNDRFTLSFNTRFETSQIKYSGESNYYESNYTKITYKTEDALAGFKSAVQYNMNENAMMYISISRGYKSGGINQNPYLSQSNRSYEPEYNWNYETGFKTYTTNMQSQLTMFYMNREDQQVNISSQQEEGNPNTFYFYTANATTGYNFGMEFEHAFNITDNFKMFYNIGYLITNVDAYEFKTNDAHTITLGDREQAQAPKYSYSYGINYKYPFGITLSCETSGKDEFYFSDSHDMKSEKYQILNVSLRYDYKSFSVTGWSKNILDERYAIRGFYFGLEPPNYEDKLYVQWADPVQYGMTLKYQF